MAFSRVAAATMAELETDVRREVGDVATTPAGDTIPAGLLAFSSAEVFRVLNNALIKLQQEMALVNPGEALTAFTLTYVEGAAGQPPGCDLPAGVVGDQVFKVEDIGTTDSLPEVVQYLSLQEIHIYERDANLVNYGLTRKFYYTLVERGTSHGILIRPLPDSGRQYRIWTIAAPLVAGLTSDAPNLATRFRELIALEAAIALMAGNRRVGPDQIARYGQLWTSFKSWASRQRGPQRIRKVDRGVY